MPRLSAQGLIDGLAQGDAGVLDGVVLVDIEVALALYLQVDAAVPPYLVEHVVEEAYAGRDLALACAVEVESDIDFGFGSVADDVSRAFTAAQKIADAAPTVGDKCRAAVERCLCNVFLALRDFGSEVNGLCTEVVGEADVGQAVANHETAGEVIVAAGVSAEKLSTWFARGFVLVLKGLVDDDVVKIHAFAGKCL
jgi:hypothetical protein